MKNPYNGTESMNRYQLSFSGPALSADRLKRQPRLTGRPGMKLIVALPATPTWGTFGSRIIMRGLNQRCCPAGFRLV